MIGLTGETINLDMENSYERAVFYEILDIVAKSSSLEFKELLYEDSPNSGWTKLDMIRVDILKQSHEISDDDVADIQRMKNIISLCTNSKFCIQCFKVGKFELTTFMYLCIDISKANKILILIPFFIVICRIAISISQES